MFGYLKILLTELLYYIQKIKGISGRSQILVFLVSVTRYFDLFVHFFSPYNTATKIIFIAFYFLNIILIYICFKSTYNYKMDRFKVEFLFLPAIILSFFFNYDHTFLEVRIFSFYLNANNSY